MATATESLNGVVVNEPVPVYEPITEPVSVNGTETEPVTVIETETEPVTVIETETEPIVTVKGPITEPVAFNETETEPIVTVNGTEIEQVAVIEPEAKSVAVNGTEAVTLAIKPRLFVECEKANEAVEFYKAAFGAEEVNRAMNTKRKADQEVPLIVSAELKIGSVSLIVSDFTEPGVRSSGPAANFILETADVVKAVEKAVAAGGTKGEEIDDSDKGIVEMLHDPYGYVWKICPPAVKETADVVA